MNNEQTKCGKEDIVESTEESIVFAELFYYAKVLQLKENSMLQIKETKA